jgi:membrane fusion protein (multidrug efflux system)
MVPKLQGSSCTAPWASGRSVLHQLHVNRQRSRRYAPVLNPEQARQSSPTQQPRHLLLVRLLVLVVAVVLAVLLVVWLRSPEQAPPVVRQAVPVEAAEVAAADLQETVRGIGTLRAPAEVVISPEAAGRVAQIHFREGNAVEQGELLVELEDEKLQRQLAAREAALKSAEARLANVQRTFERQQNLVEQGLVSEQEFEGVRTELQSAEADVERFRAELALIREQVQDTVIRAPFAGVISERLVDPGAYVAPGDALARLYQLDPLELSFSVPERYAGRIEPGQEVAVRPAAFPEQTFTGRVDYVSPAIEETTRTLDVKAVVPNSDNRLKPGGFATAVVTVGTRENRPVVPAEALVATRTGYMVFVIEDGVAEARKVATGLRREGMVEITDGLQPGEAIVHSGHMRLEHGREVEVVDRAGPSEGETTTSSETSRGSG